MVLVAVVLVGALAVGALAGGSLTRLGELPLRRRWLLAVAVLAQVGGGVAAALTHDATAYVAGLAASALVAAGFLVGNLRVPGLPLVAAGLLLNAAVVAANGAMPVSLHAAARAGVSTGALAAGDPRHVPAGPDTRLSLLGDVVPVPTPVQPQVVSPGDVLVAAGLALLVVAGMRRRDANEGSAGEPAEPSRRPWPISSPPR